MLPQITMDDVLKSVGFCAVYVLLMSLSCVLCDSSELEETESIDRFKLEGKIDLFSAGKNKDWVVHARVFVDGGDYVGLLKSDGSFVISGLPSGSYVVEVSHPAFIFDAARVDITSKGKIRARKVNYLQPSQVKSQTYPLFIQERQKTKYFQDREQWKVTDFLFNPMVLTMVLPLLLIMVLPKLMNAADPEAQQEMQNQMKALNDKSNLPDLSEMFAGLFGGGSKKQAKAKAIKRR
ncbi:ER membrane protein complex subunit 7-like [Mytilus trossulus]|uniref:ER membrane protein complex subunit 7-like n=1 Tax=Mytilus trossulus TaxID=6551 RepID=UPI0030077B5F